MGDNSVAPNLPAKDIDGESRIINATGKPTAIVDMGVDEFSTAEVLTLSASSLIYSTQAVGTSSTPQSVTFTNHGIVTANISAVLTGGDFSQTNTCGTSLAAGANCSVSVTFAPTVRGSWNGVMAIMTDASESPQVVFLSGTATGPVVSLSGNALFFNAQVMGTTSAAQPVTLLNAGDGPLTFTSIVPSGDFAIAMTGTTCQIATPVAAGASCTINVTFTPTATGNRTGTLTITDNATDSPQTIRLSGTGLSLGVVGLSTTMLTFPNTLVGTTSAAQTLTLTNTGTGPLTISSILTTFDFAETNNCPLLPATLAPLANCTISVTFTPSFPGPYNGSLQISTDASIFITVVNLSGTGLLPAVALSPSTLSFALQVVGSTSAAQAITATNNAGTTVGITSIVASGDFAQSNTCGSSLAPAATCAISVTFTPTVTGARTGSVTVTFNGIASPQTTSLSGKGISAAAAQLAWKQKAPFNDPRAGSDIDGAAADLISGKLYLSHGYRGFLNTDAPFLSIYDVATDAWTYGAPTAPDAAVARAELGGGTALGKHFAIGGRNATGVTAANEQFDPSTTLWTTKASMSMARGGLGAASFNDKIYAVGGRTGFSFGSEPGFGYGLGPILNLVEVYDPKADAWTTLAPLPVAVSDNYATVALNGKIYVFGGTTGGGSGTTNLVQIYDIASNTWSSGAPMPTARGAAMAGVIASKIAVFGGVSFNPADATLTNLAVTELYDPATNTWQPGPDMASPTSGIAQGMTSDGTQIFAVGSGISGVFASSVQLLVAPVVRLSQPSLAMGAQTVDTTSSAQTLAVTNVGGVALPMSNIAASGDFAQTNNCPVSPAALATRASCTITITFTPKAQGTRTGTVTISDLALDGPQTVSLSGTGVAADFSISPASSSSTTATVTAGQAATYSLSLAATPGFTATVTLSCSGAPADAKCAASPPSLTLSAMPSKVKVTATTTARSLAFRRPELRLPSLGRHGGLTLLVWVLLLTILALMAAARRGRAWAGVAVTMLLVLFWAGCGGGGGGAPPPPSGTPAGTYTLTLTATSGKLSHSMALTLTVK